MRTPREWRPFRRSWIYFIGLLISTAVILAWYHLDPATPRIALR